MISPSPAKLVVGHNDPGYAPDATPVEVSALSEAIRVMVNDIQTYFLPEVEDSPDAELTPADVRRFQNQALRAQRGSTIMFRGHAFWVM